MIAQKISSMVTHAKFTKVPTLTPPFLCCDVNVDKVHWTALVLVWVTPQTALSDNFSLSSLQQAPYSFLSPLSCKNDSKQAQVPTNMIAWHVSSWPFETLSTSLLTSLFTRSSWSTLRSTLVSSWWFCCTEFLWKGYQTLFSLPKHKAVWPHKTRL